MYILTQSIARGRQAGWISVLGVSTGILIHTLFAAFGLSAILATSAWAFLTVKFVGAAYLIYLGVQALLKKSRPSVTPEFHTVSELHSVSCWKIYRQGVLTNVLNPKVAIFFLAFLPQFVVPTAQLGALPFLFLGTVFVVGGTLWCLLVALFAATASRRLRRETRVMKELERIAGCVYIALGFNLLRSQSQST
ncbi:MAG: LysE family translocator [Drouetiella hepatica Uher 2000/2452]|uniref:LysE family translocator n=1 Tax=Drouetiella hepatica Uher 2000/2452 TaxID=904376 RepID=A0A951Q907_9CYAN|nr:LysE family translocator [Drouetiella hepatica Uher 2000/2452]